MARSIGIFFIIIVLLPVVIPTVCYGQLGTVKGRLKNVDDDQCCALVAVSLLSTDSTLIRAIKSGNDGRFELTQIKLGRYILRVADISFETYYEKILVNNRAIIDVGDILLHRRVDSLTAAIVTSRFYGPRLKGDTLEYDVHNIAMNRNATVEELLRRLPGLSIAADGTITYNGQKIDHLTVDGEDIFGGSPTLVTQNFNADLIAKIQLFDQRSFPSQWTGIDDGTRIKTLNLSLKEDKKHGYTGKVEGGAGDDGYYSGDGIVGAFSGARQMVGLGIASNIGSRGLSGNGSGVQGALNVGFVPDPLGAIAGVGIPQVVGTGLHYADRMDNHQQHVSGNIEYGYMATNPYNTITTLQILPDTQYLQKQQSHSHNIINQETGYITYDFDVDSLSAASISVDMQEGKGHNTFVSNATGSFNDILVNASNQTIQSDVVNQHFASNLEWRTKRKRHPKQTLAMVLHFENGNNTSNGYLYDLNPFYQSNGILYQIDTTDQHKIVSNKGSQGEGQLAFTDEVSKILSWGVGYDENINYTQALQSAYSKANGKYDNFIDSLSNDYKDLVTVEKLSPFVQTEGRHIMINFGSDFKNSHYRQDDALLNNVTDYHFLSVEPHLRIRDAIRSQTNLFFNYTVIFQPPAISLLQPVQNNTNPLSINLGNPHLSGTYTNQINLKYEHAGGKPFSVELNAHFDNSDIGGLTYTDSLGRQIHQPVNVPGSLGADGGVYLNRHLNEWDMNWGCNVVVRYGESYSYINTALDKSYTVNAGGGLFLDKYVANKYNFRFSTNVNYNYLTNSVDVALPLHYWTAVSSAGAAVFPFSGTEINSSVNYNWQQKTGSFDQGNNIIVWNAYIGRDFWDHRFTFRAGINDILNQNTLIMRGTNLNYETQTVMNSIGRYWMFSAIFHFEHQQKKK